MSAAFRTPEAALGRVAHPLRTTEPRGGLADLRPFGLVVGDARVVGLGEASHSSHEFFTVKHRVLRYLVEEKAFGPSPSKPCGAPDCGSTPTSCAARAT